MDTPNHINDAPTSDEGFYILRLFITGTSPTSVRALKNLQVLLSKHLEGRYSLEVIDIYQQPLLVKQDNVTAVPMLIKKQPFPIRRLIGDLSDTARVLQGLGLF